MPPPRLYRPTQPRRRRSRRRVAATAAAAIALAWAAGLAFPGWLGAQDDPAPVVINEVLPNTEARFIDFYGVSEVYPENLAATPSEYITVFLQRLALDRPQFSFLHFRGPDAGGHLTFWGSQVQREAVEAVDFGLGRVFAAVEGDPEFAGDTVIILTSDHGGGGRIPFTHLDPTRPLNFTVPFYVWGAGVEPGADLYDLNPGSRTRPAASVNPRYSTYQAAAPVRNADLCNLALGLLGLPPVPGSWINPGQDLAVGTGKGAGGGGAPPPVGHVIAISVDGLRPIEVDALGPARAPNLHRFRTEGATTDNARTDVDFTVTNPNHACMLTGRGVNDVPGLGRGNGYSANDIIITFPDQNGGRYVPGVFEVVKASGGRSIFFANKAKFNGFFFSWGAGSWDRIELFNRSAEPVDIGNWLLSDSAQQLGKLRFGPTVVIPPAGFLLLDEKTHLNPSPEAPLPGHFSLDGLRGGKVFLSRPGPGGGPETVDQISYGPVPFMVSYGRSPNGGETLYPLASQSFGRLNSGVRPGSVSVTEIHYRPAAGDAAFIEVGNAAPAPARLDGWTLGGVGFTFPAGAEIPARGVALLVGFDPGDAAAAEAFRSAYPSAAGATLLGSWVSPPNPGTPLVLSRLGEEVAPPGQPAFRPLFESDRVAFTAAEPWPAIVGDGGVSLVRTDPLGNGDDPLNWSAGTPSPGRISPVPLELWRTAFFRPGEIDLPAAAPGADFDQDGIPNLLEVVTGTDPRRPDPPTPFPEVEFREGAAGPAARLAVTYRRRVYPPLAAHFALEVSTDLQNWSEVAPDPGTRVFDNGDGTEVVTLEADSPVPAPPVLLRLRVAGDP